MRAIAEVLVDSTICLPPDQPALVLRHPDGSFEVRIQNNPGADPFARNALRIAMDYEVENIAEARDQALDNMAIVLNSLCRVTGGKFDNVTVLRAFDASPGLEQRDGRYYSTQRAVLSMPGLDEEFAKTAERFMAIHDDDVSQSVMRWYRLGRRADNPEEQFMYLWFAVEIAAESLKEAGKIGVKCPKCQSDLFCSSCGEAPQRRRVSSDAIKDLIIKVAPPVENPGQFYDILSKIRNTLQHGRRFHSIADTLPCSEEQAIMVLANVAWRAISFLGNPDADPNPDDDLILVSIEDVQNKTMVMTTTMVTSFAKGDSSKPTIEDAPNVNISLMIGERKFTFDGQEVLPKTGEA